MDKISFDSKWIQWRHCGDPFPIQQTIAGVEIDVDSDDFQEWYHSITKFPLAAIFEAHHKISEILDKYFKESNRTNRQKQRYFYAT